MKCEFLETIADGQVLAGTVLLEDGKLSLQVEKGHERLVQNILNDPVVPRGGGEAIFAKDNPTEWFYNLPCQYNGSYFRARLLGPNDAPWEKGSDVIEVEGPNPLENLT